MLDGARSVILLGNYLDTPGGILFEAFMDQRIRKSGGKGVAMPKRIYIENLPVDVDQEQVASLVRPYGQVQGVSLESSRSGTRAVVTLGTGGDQAVAALNGRNFGGRALNVNEARPR